MAIVTIGILAHVDAGKTTLTERILFAIRVFTLNERKVHLIDTPGYADFVAEVARSLRMLDGVVLVVSAVEGVQPQTRRLTRAIRAAGLPLLLFVNKVDRLAAGAEARSFPCTVFRH
jgi:ribosomal protection tetracycline resistance protein